MVKKVPNSIKLYINRIKYVVWLTDIDRFAVAYVISTTKIQDFTSIIIMTDDRTKGNKQFIIKNEIKM